LAQPGPVPGPGAMSGGPACTYCATPGSSKRCSLCREVAYCSLGCQQAHWREHKAICSRRFPAPAPAPALAPGNLCTRCGKEGKLLVSGQWLCSHDCCCSEFSSLTESIRRLSQPPPGVQMKEDKRIMDWINGTISEPPAVSNIPPPPSSKPVIDASKLQEKERTFLGLPPKDEQDPALEPGSRSRSEYQRTVDRVKELMGSGSGHQAPCAGASAQQPGIVRDDPKTLDRIKALMKSHEQAPTPELKAEMGREDPKTIDRIKALVADCGEPAVAVQDVDDDGAVIERVKSLVSAGEEDVKQRWEKMQSSTYVCMAEEAGRVADFIRLTCSLSPAEALARARGEGGKEVKEPKAVKELKALTSSAP